MLLLHHNRKNGGSDDLHTISGSTGLTGGADNCIIIERPKRGEKIAKLKVVSRDMESFEMEIMQGDGGIWIAAEDKELAEKEISVTVRAVYLFYTLTHFSDEPLVVSPTELSESINRLFSISIPPTMIKKNLTADHEDLESLGLKFDYERTKQGRKLLFSENDNYSKPKYFYFDEKGKFVFDAFFSSEYEDEVSGDSGDRVTGETDSENISSSTVNRDDQETKADEKGADECQENAATDSSETDSDDSSDAPVTADSQCENNCQPVTADNADQCEIVSEESNSSISDDDYDEDDYDEEDEFTHDPDAEKELDEFLKNVSDALVKKCAAQGITIPPFDPNKKIDRSAPEVCEDNISTDTSENDSGDSSDDTVTADSRCENNCQPVNRCQPAAENNKKPVQNYGGNRKKHGKKSKKKKGGKKH